MRIRMRSRHEEPVRPLHVAGLKPSLLTMALLVLATLGPASLVQGSCLSYGHSCWGAHGKRSGGGGGGGGGRVPEAWAVRAAAVGAEPDSEAEADGVRWVAPPMGLWRRLQRAGLEAAEAAEAARGGGGGRAAPEPAVFRRSPPSNLAAVEEAMASLAGAAAAADGESNGVEDGDEAGAALMMAAAAAEAAAEAEAEAAVEAEAADAEAQPPLQPLHALRPSHKLRFYKAFSKHEGESKLQ